MVSRRNYFSIIIMMAVLFFMFQFSQIIKESGNKYNENEFARGEGELPSGVEQWKPSDMATSISNDEYILFFGDEESELGNVVAQWCNYTKRELVFGELYEYPKPEQLPELILLDAEFSEVGRKSVFLEPVLEWGVPIVFCNVPEAKDIQKSELLQKVLGIREVRAIETQVLGIRMFSGFLLGGEALYEAKTENEWKRQDMDLTVPWFITASGTETYMVGTMDEDVVDREEFPCLIWRNNYENTKIFAVCGDYMSTLAGLGILDAITYELYPYEIYPIINAQNVVIANFPGFSTENADKIMQLYSRSPKFVYQDIMWPSISAMVKTNDLKLTCLFNPQYDYQDGLEPNAAEVVFYLQQLKELGAEAGMSLTYKEGTELLEVLDRDADFYESLDGNYRYQAVYVEEKDVEQVISSIADGTYLQGVTTITGKYNGDRPLVAYLSDGVTLQGTTGEAREHTYMDNFTDRSLQTALGYSNVLLDLHTAIWPENSEDEWQNLYDDMSSNVHTYWPGNRGFEQTTLSESDIRVRNFLNLDYADERSGDTVVLQIYNTTGPVWFVLRTHDEKIVDINGGEYELLENNVYLIKADTETVEIQLEALTLKEMGEKN